MGGAEGRQDNLASSLNRTERKLSVSETVGLNDDEPAVAVDA